MKGQSQKESELASTLRKRERCDENFGEQEKVHVKYPRDKIGMLPDAEKVPCNEKLYPRSYRNTWDPDENDLSCFIWQEIAELLKRETSRKPHLMHCVSFFNCMQL